MNIERQPSCEDPQEQPELLPVAEARARIHNALPAPRAPQRLVLPEALGRVLATDIESPIDVPGYTNSAMDGYAINTSDIPAADTRTLQVAGTAWAGRPFTGQWQSGQAVRIMTGAMMPAGCDTVVIQEHVRVEAGQVVIDSDVRAGANVRQAGEDVGSGDVVMQAGTRLLPAHIGVLASLGIGAVSVTPPVRVAFFSTGDELRPVDVSSVEPESPPAALEPGQLFDSNRHTLRAMLQRLGVETLDLGIVPDNAEATRAALQQAASADVIVTSGGVSAGEADFVTRLFHEMGDVGFWKLAMRPGRPLAFGNIGDTVFFGLPGNPVAVMVTFYEFVQPALQRLQGHRDVEPLLLPAKSQSALRKTPGRTEYQRGVVSRSASGELQVETTGKQGAGRLSSMCVANCLIVLPPECERVEPGDLVDVHLFDSLV